MRPYRVFINGMEQDAIFAPSYAAARKAAKALHRVSNGDSSGLEDPADKAGADAFADWLGGYPVDCEDAGFLWSHDASRFMPTPLGADCQRYMALVEERP